MHYSDRYCTIAMCNKYPNCRFFKELLVSKLVLRVNRLQYCVQIEIANMQKSDSTNELDRFTE